MPYSRKYDFQPGTKASSSQVDEEFDQLIAAVNQIQTDDNTKDADLRLKAQMVKITNDTGDVKVKVSATTGDILQELITAGVGVHTFYAIAGSKNLPGTLSIRGEAHITSPGFGWVKAYDTNNKSWTNSLNNSIWSGWEHLLSNKDTQDTLWSGFTALDVDGTGAPRTVTPTKKLSECKNGWLLIWSDYDPGVGTNDNDFDYTYIPKGIIDKHSGAGHLFPVGQYLSDTQTVAINKRVKIFDDKLQGYAENNSSSTATNDVTLRYVLEW